MIRNVLVIGSGGREHALTLKLAQSLRISSLYAAPGNPGTAQVAENVAISANDIPALAQFAEKNKIDMTIVGPDDPLAEGIVDAFRGRGLKAFGPTRGAAQIESSKVFAKEMMLKHGIPTPAFQVFRSYGEALVHVQRHGAPIVVKASGLALGKGVYVCRTLDEARKALRDIMVNRVLKDAGDEVVIEEYVEGQEISIHAFCDGKTFVLLPPAQDHKPIRDGDEGPNTGGMGVIEPVPWVSSETMLAIGDRIVKPTLQALTNLGHPFSGLLYPGLMMTSGGPKVLEFNARFGDPETQCHMRLLKTDLLDIAEACVEGTLSELQVEWHPGFSVCIVLASAGYPGVYDKGKQIYGIEAAERIPGVVVFHAGTSTADGTLRTSGGRVLGISAIGDTLQEALDSAYEAARQIRFDGARYRRDIGAKAFAASTTKT